MEMEENKAHDSSEMAYPLIDLSKIFESLDMTELMIEWQDLIEARNTNRASTISGSPVFKFKEAQNAKNPT